jgi:hypothetical protein
LEDVMTEKKTSWKTDSDTVVVVSVTVVELAKLCLTSSVEVSDICDVVSIVLRGTQHAHTSLLISTLV